MSTITNNLELWQKEAEEQAKKQSEAIKNNSQYLIDQLNESKNNALTQLQQQQDNAIYNLNTNKATINSDAEESAKQANISRLLALKSNEQSLNRAGLGSQGIVGSQNTSINNSYSQNLTSILNQKNNDLRELEKEKNDTLLKYNENRLNLENEYGDSIANIRAEIDANALNQYNSIYDAYIAYKQQEYENEQNRLAQQEAIRQYNEQMAYQKEQDALAQANWEKEYALSKKSITNNTNYTTLEENNSIELGSTSANGKTIIANPKTNSVNSDAQYGVFDTGDGTGYQPNNVGGVSLSKTGKKVSDIYGNSAISVGGSSLSKQNIWTANGKYYVWDGAINDYIDITDDYKTADGKYINIKWGGI